MNIPFVYPPNLISSEQLEDLNKKYNGNLLALTSLEYAIWKNNLIKMGYIWNDIDSWGYWTIPSQHNIPNSNYLNYNIHDLI